MTSSERNLYIGQLRWNSNIQQYKYFDDVFCEKGLISILFLACGRPEITRRCLLSTIDAVTSYSGPLEWIFMENGENEENYNLFQGLDLERKVIIRQKNFGINESWNQMINISRGEWYFVHENDFEHRATGFNFLEVARNIFEECGDVGVVQLRAIYDPCENFGLNKSKYNPWSCSQEQNELEGVKLLNGITKSGHDFLVGRGFYGFNNNPNIISKSLYRECGYYPECEMGCDPAHGETLYQEKILKTGCAIAHIKREVYYHIGNVKTKSI